MPPAFCLGIASGRPVDDISFHLKKWDLPFDFDVLVGLNGCEVQNNVTGAYSIPTSSTASA